MILIISWSYPFVLLLIEFSFIALNKIFPYEIFIQLDV